MCRGPGSERKRLRLGTAVVACLWLFASVAQAQVSPVHDINPDIGSSCSYTELLVASEDIVVISGDAGSSGLAIWRTDCTSAVSILVVEVCLTSNQQTVPELADDLRKHPFAEMRRRRLSTTFCTDNRLVSRTSVSREILRAFDAFWLNPAEVCNSLI